jgi:hypothetical protein
MSRMLADHVRDAAATGAILGLFASTWFGWAQEAPPRTLRPFLIAGSVLSFVMMAVALVLTIRHWSDGTVFDAHTSPRFGIVVGIEFGVAALGALVLGLRGRREVIPAWIAFVVGIHLFPVAFLLDYPFLHVVAALVTVASVAAVPVARRRGIAVSAAVGLSTGTVLLLSGWISVGSIPAIGAS